MFQYPDDAGELRAVDSADVNEYLGEATGDDFTAKDFRTWAGTVLAAQALQELEAFDSEAQAKRNLVRAVEAVAKRLGNTPSVCRKCYIHPAVIDTYLDGETLSTLWNETNKRLNNQPGGLTPDEEAVLTLLRKTAEASGK